MRQNVTQQRKCNTEERNAKQRSKTEQIEE